MTFRQIWDLELLLCGAFAPLKGFLGKADYEGVCKDMRLAGGALWPMPIMLDVTEELADELEEGGRLALRHPEGMVLAVMSISDIWKADKEAEAEAVLGTTSEEHPAVFQLMRHTNPVYVGGTLEGVELPPHHTFRHLRHTPEQLKTEFERLGWQKIVAFQTRNPMHRAHVELCRDAVHGRLELASTLVHVGYLMVLAVAGWALSVRSFGRRLQA